MHTVECIIDIEVFQDSFIDGVAWVAVSTQSRTKKAEAEKFLGLTPPSRKPKPTTVCFSRCGMLLM